MNKKTKIALALLVLSSGIAIGGLLLVLAVGGPLFSHDSILVLNPKGMIGEKQRALFVLATRIMLIVVIPVFVLTIWFAWKYRAGNQKGEHRPDWDHNLLAEAIWWGIPLIIIVVLGVITWKSCHELDPFKPIASTTKPLRIQVVALRWKWLFIYPEEGIATVNFIQFPVDTPIDFEITADAPMNSFWIPQLGGQIYAMSGMKSKLHLIANYVGTFRGMSSNFSGKGFSGMTFFAKASSREEYDQWIASVKQSPQSLNADEYQKLVEPSSYNPAATYASTDPELFEWIVMKDMGDHASGQ